MSNNTDRVLESFVYHILHPNGRGRDVAPLLYGGTVAQCYVNMSNRDCAILQRITQCFNRLIVSIVSDILNGDSSSIVDLLETDIAQVAEEFYRPGDNVPDEELDRVDELYNNWVPSPEETELHMFVTEILFEPAFSEDEFDSEDDDTSAGA